jgi:ABC-type enterobactin transport system permease subunit
MLCIAFFICLVAGWRRSAAGTTIVGPMAVMSLVHGQLALRFVPSAESGFSR